MSLQPFDLNLRHLRALPLIISRGSMSAAAEAVGLSQPALTQGLAKLEKQLGSRLFDREVDGMAPTADGQLLANRTEAAMSHLIRGLRAGGRVKTRPEQLMTATQLRAFLSVADHGGFIQASVPSGMSQPAVHRAVRELEQICGYTLFERKGRGVLPTPSGLRLARGVRLARTELSAALDDMAAREGNDRGNLTVGAMPLSRARLLPRAIARFTAEFPKVHIDVVEGSWRELTDPLLDGVLDLMVGALREAPPHGLTQSPLMTDQLVVVGRAGHPILGVEDPTLSALRAYPWVIGQRQSPLRAIWEKMFNGELPSQAPIECGSVMVIRQLLLETDFLTLLSPSQIWMEIATEMLVSIGVPPAHGRRTIGLSTREGWKPTTAQARFVEILQDIARTYPQI